MAWLQHQEAHIAHLNRHLRTLPWLGCDIRHNILHTCDIRKHILHTELDTSDTCHGLAATLGRAYCKQKSTPQKLAMAWLRHQEEHIANRNRHLRNLPWLGCNIRKNILHTDINTSETCHGLATTLYITYCTQTSTPQKLAMAWLQHQDKHIAPRHRPSATCHGLAATLGNTHCTQKSTPQKLAMAWLQHQEEHIAHRNRHLRNLPWLGCDIRHNIQHTCDIRSHILHTELDTSETCHGLAATLGRTCCEHIAACGPACK